MARTVIDLTTDQRAVIVLEDLTRVSVLAMPTDGDLIRHGPVKLTLEAPSRVEITRTELMRRYFPDWMNPYGWKGQTLARAHA